MHELALAIGALRPQDVADALTPQEMNQWLAFFRVKWQHETLPYAHVSRLQINATGADIEFGGLDYIGRLWPK